jgi:hypothetical protein
LPTSDIIGVDCFDFAPGDQIRGTNVSLVTRDNTRIKVLAGQYLGYSRLMPPKTLPSPIRPNAEQIAAFLGVQVNPQNPTEARSLET